MQEDLMARLRPKWRRAEISGFDVEVRNPTVADSARRPAPDWWLPCVRNPDGTPFFPAKADAGEINALIANDFLLAIMEGTDRPTQPPTGGSPAG